MEMKEIRDLQFIQQKGFGIECFGIVAERNDQEGVIYGMYVDMDGDFGTWTTSFDKIEAVDEDTIRKNLSIIAERREEFPYFIIQLNDIPELKAYHIDEDDFIKNIRTTNEVCLYCEEVSK